MGQIHIAVIVAILISGFNSATGIFQLDIKINDTKASTFSDEKVRNDSHINFLKYLSNSLGVVKPQANESVETYDGEIFNSSTERKVKEDSLLTTAKIAEGIVSRATNNDRGNKVVKAERRNSRCRFQKRFLENAQDIVPKKGINDARQGKNGQSKMLDSFFQRGPKYIPDGKDFSGMNLDDNWGEKYHYYDFNPLMNSQTERMWRINDMNIPDPYMMRFENAKSMSGRTQPRPVVNNNSCKQYLDFLRYAFEQLDSSSSKSPTNIRDYDYYYDNPYDYDQMQGRFPTIQKISANMDLLNALSYYENNHPNKTTQRINPQSKVHTTSLNGQEITSKDVTVETMKLSEFNRSNPASLSAPWTLSTNAVNSNFRFLPTVGTGSSFQTASTPATPEAIEKATLEQRMSNKSATSTTDHKNSDEKHEGQLLRVGISAEKPEKFDMKQDDSNGCNEKMFPCPDNLNVTYPINGYCNRFVACESGKPHPEFCQEGLHFNLVTKQCDLPHNSICTYSCPQENGFYGIPGDCEGFFRCQNWYPEYRMCPPRMHWDLKAKICTFQELSSCPLKCDAPFEVKSYNGVCNAYIVCTRGIPQYHKCPDGTHFERKKLKCLPKTESVCMNDKNYITRNRGIENGLKKLCADIKIKDGVSHWCQEPTNID